MHFCPLLRHSFAVCAGTESVRREKSNGRMRTARLVERVNMLRWQGIARLIRIHELWPTQMGQRTCHPPFTPWSACKMSRSIREMRGRHLRRLPLAEVKPDVQMNIQVQISTEASRLSPPRGGGGVERTAVQQEEATIVGGRCVCFSKKDGKKETHIFLWVSTCKGQLLCM